MSVSAPRLSDAQFSTRELERIRIAARKAFKLSCPRCGEALTWSTINEPTTPPRAVCMIRCSHCRRFLILRNGQDL